MSQITHLGLLLSLFFVTTPAYCAVFSVSSGDASGLIAAINAANSNGEENTINIAPGTYSLTTIDNTVVRDGPNGLPIVTSHLTITTVPGESAIVERVADAEAFRIVYIGASGVLTLQGVTIRGGHASRANGEGRGGGIFNRGILTITATVVENNSADDGGGGIWNHNSTVKTSQSTVQNNIAVFGGGGISSLGGTLTVQDSVISGNADQVAGGGIDIGPGVDGFPNSATIINSRVSENSTGGLNGVTFGRGGGIISGSSNVPPGTSKLVITNSTVSGNRSKGVGGGISVLDTWTISNSTISSNEAAGAGGGIENAGGVGTVINSTLANNTAAQGGAFVNGQGQVILVSSTVSGNLAQEGGGIATTRSDATSGLSSTILANNSAKNGPDCETTFGGTFNSFGHNLIGDLTGCPIQLLTTDLFGSPDLGEFSDNGEPGNGHFPLLPTSRAIDAGDNNACLSNPSLSEDQIGNPRVGPCDIGAIEFQPAPPIIAFAGVPGKPDCHGKSVSALARQFGGLPAAASALGFPTVRALQDAVKSFCEQ